MLIKLIKNKELISIEEAIKEVEVAMTRLALMHLSFSKILIEEFGKEKGKKIIVKAITEYGCRIAEKIAEGGKDLPTFGVHREVHQNKEGEFSVKGCILAKVFKQYDEQEYGSLYCYVDLAKSMATDETKKIIHKSCEACGDNKCILAFVPTTKEDRKSFKDRDKDLIKLDPYLANKY